MQHEDQCRHIHHRRRHLFRLDYFFAGSAVFVSTLATGASLLTGAVSAFLASTLQFLSLAGSHFAGAALAAGAGVAVLAGSVAKAAVATKVAITVAIVFI
jgi:hypothetical protein